MHDLTLVGVHEDGTHLLLSDDDGKRYLLPLNDALRAAARRDRPRLGQLQIEIEGGLRPRDVQALLRTGLSTQAVADRAGWSVEKVQKFEGPVLAEREYAAQRAKAAPLRPDRPSPTLEERVLERLRARDVDLTQVVWDAWRPGTGRWRVAVTFSAGGRERTATWSFDAATAGVRAHDDEARWLSEDDPAPSPVSHVDPAATADEPVFDVEGPARRAAHRPRPRPAHAPTPEPAAHDDGARPAPVGSEDELTSAIIAHHWQLRDRRGRRRAHRPAQSPTPSGDTLPLDTTAADDGKHAHSEPVDSELADAHATDPTPDDPQAGAPDTTSEASTRSGRRGRPSVPAWDDVVFGTRSRHADSDPQTPER